MQVWEGKRVGTDGLLHYYPEAYSSENLERRVARKDSNKEEPKFSIVQGLSAELGH